MNQMGREELDSLLDGLAFIAQQHPPLTSKRQLVLGQLVQAILRSGRLCHPYRGQFLHRYEEIYEEARQDLLFYVCHNIDKYNPERGGVMAWFNVLLERRFFREAIPKVLDKQGIQKMTLSDLDNLAPPEKSPNITEVIMEYIASDPENLFKSSHIESRPEANFQTLSQQRLEGKSWKEISEKLGIKIPTISSFYYRCLNRFASKLKEYCKNYLT
jgi:DNA-directed RNA polymerase specialized sigma24 family protein